MNYDIIIVGGGISGLTLAYECQKAQVSHLVLEAAPRVGGCIHTFEDHTQHTGPLELGTHTFYNTYTECIALIQELGLSIIEKPASKLYVHTLKTPDKRTPLLHQLNPLQALYHLLKAAGIAYCMPNKLSPAPGDLPGKLGYLLGKGNAKRVAIPAVQALYNQPLDNIPAPVLFNRKKREKLKAFPRRFSLKGGNDQLVKAMAKKSNVLTNQPVTDIKKHQTGFTCYTQEAAYNGQHVVLAVPGHIAGQFTDIVDTHGYNPSTFSVDFTTQVRATQQPSGPAFVVFQAPDQYSEIIFPHTPAFKVCHAAYNTPTENSLYIKTNTVPNLTQLNHITPTTDKVHLIGNYFSGLSVEDAIHYAKATFKKITTARKQP